MIDEPFPASFYTKELRNTSGKSTLKPPRRLGLVPGSQWALAFKKKGSCWGETKRLKERTSVPEALLLTFFPDLSQIIPVDMMVPRGALEKSDNTQFCRHFWIQYPFTTHILQILLLRTFHSRLGAAGAAAPSWFWSDGSELMMWSSSCLRLQLIDYGRHV